MTNEELAIELYRRQPLPTSRDIVAVCFAGAGNVGCVRPRGYCSSPFRRVGAEV